VAKLNLVIRAFDADELQMLNDIIIKREKQALEDGFILSEPFQELKDKIQLANKYANGINRDHIA
jgi:hypothetical protein